MKKKRTFYTELSYFLGIFLLAVSTQLMLRADFGMSMVVAPAFVVGKKLQEFWPWLSDGMAQYLFQGVMLLVMCLVMRRFRITYLLAFASSVLFGLMLDGFALLMNMIPVGGVIGQHLNFVGGVVIGSLGVSLMFHTYLTPEVYELVVVEAADMLHKDASRVKTVYDIVSTVFAVGMSFLFFGLWHFEGVKIGTVVCALVNGFLIGLCTKILEHFFEFKDGWKLRKFFKGEQTVSANAAGK